LYFSFLFWSAILVFFARLPKKTLCIILVGKENSMADIAKHIFFAGSVQGVGFRFTAQRIASRYELNGFVRNMPDGRVEMLVQGSPENIDNCIEDLQRTFPVSQTKIEQAAFDSSCQDFKITF
jgi:acylphosphatase